MFLIISSGTTTRIENSLVAHHYLINKAKIWIILLCQIHLVKTTCSFDLYCYWQGTRGIHQISDIVEVHTSICFWLYHQERPQSIPCDCSDSLKIIFIDCVHVRHVVDVFNAAIYVCFNVNNILLCLVCPTFFTVPKYYRRTLKG
jgi:hypothetical protein